MTETTSTPAAPRVRRRRAAGVRSHLAVKAAVTLGVLVTVLGTAVMVLGGQAPATGRVRPRLTHVPAGIQAHFDHQGFLVLHADRMVRIPGYEGEPYLELSPRLVRENRRSPSAWLNRRLTPVGEPPSEADADAAPVWVTLGHDPTVRYHDHRTHWMAARPPAGAHAGAVVTRFRLPLTVDGHRRVIRGELVLSEPTGDRTLILTLAAFAVVMLGTALVWLARLGCPPTRDPEPEH